MLVRGIIAIRGRLVAALALGLVLAVAPCAQGQGTKPPVKKRTPKQKPRANPAAADAAAYKIVEMPQGVRFAQARGDALTVLRGEGSGNAPLAVYFGQVVPAVMTQYRDVDLVGTGLGPPYRAAPTHLKLPTFRAMIMAEYGRTADPTLLAAANEILLPKLLELAGDGYHPEVRYNAMLMVGALDQTLANPAAGVAKATPLAAALAKMIPAADDPNGFPAVRVAALIGIQRHVELSTTGVAAVRAALLKILKEAPKATDPSTDGISWLKMRAITLLNIIGPAALTNEFSNELATMVGDTRLHLAARCTAAGALGRLPLDTATFKATDLVANLGKLQFEVCTQEIDNLPGEADVSASKKMQFRCGCIKQALAGDGDAKHGLPTAKIDDAQKQLVEDLKAAQTAIDELFVNDSAPAAAMIAEKAGDLKKLLQTHKIMAADPPKAVVATPKAAPKAAPKPAPGKTPPGKEPGKEPSKEPGKEPGKEPPPADGKEAPKAPPAKVPAGK